MDKLKDKLLKLKEELVKGMNNAGIGGPGAVKRLGAILPSVKAVTTAGKKTGNNSSTPSLGIKQPSKKNPVKQAEQIQNSDIKDHKMKEAKAQLNQMEKLSLNKGGQWSIEKSGYKGYTETDNINRKKNNLSEDTGIHTMNRIKRYGGSGPSAASKEAADMKRKSKKNPVKVYTPEEIKAYEESKKK